jgi:hypothetical protein
MASVVIMRPATERSVLQRDPHDLRRIDNGRADHID